MNSMDSLKSSQDQASSCKTAESRLISILRDSSSKRSKSKNKVRFEKNESPYPVSISNDATHSDLSHAITSNPKRIRIKSCIQSSKPNKSRTSSMQLGSEFIQNCISQSSAERHPIKSEYNFTFRDTDFYHKLNKFYSKSKKVQTSPKKEAKISSIIRLIPCFSVSNQ